MRTFSTAFLAALMVMALFLGNCFSCPQMLLALNSHQPAHRCCHHSQKASQECQTQVLQQFVKSTARPVAPLMASAAPVASFLAQAVAPAAGMAPDVLYVPLDRLALHASLRI
ncbi:MAG TPA: hypothetical protein VME43_00650 [Bryobacteraceae bacterium]|nr:hypothetical protein [Bryobacteraceae bacterium]